MLRKIRAALLAAALALGLMAGLSAAAPQFSDVPQGAWHHDMVSQMAREGLVQGYADGSFRPQAPVTAAELVTVLCRIAPPPPATGSTAVDHWAAADMGAAGAAGWYDYDEAPPSVESYDRPVTRQLAVRIIMKALLPQARGLYSDWADSIADLAQLDGRYYEPVFAAYEAGVIEGDSYGRLNPQDPVTRAEMCAMVLRAQGKAGLSSAPAPESPAPGSAAPGGASSHGWLSVSGTQLVSEAGEAVRLTGMSTHGMQWYGDFANAGAMADLAGRGANLIRLALYPGEGGYMGNEAAMTEKMTAAVDAAIAQDLYVIIDWHILSEQSPGRCLAEAQAFFEAMAQRYGACPNVLYEICNEPNGQDVTWQKDIKPYAQAVIPVIRRHAPQAVVIVGTGTWSQDVDAVAASPLELANVMYALHFYAGTHGQPLRDKAEAALEAGTPIFVTEWGTGEATGDGRIDLEESGRWLDFMARHGLSWANWSLCDKAEAASALRPGASKTGGWADGDLTASGRFVFDRFGK